VSTFAATRDVAVAIGSAAAQVDLATIDESLGPILDPTAFMRGSESLSNQVRYLRAFRTFRAAIEEFNPARG